MDAAAPPRLLRPEPRPLPIFRKEDLWFDLPPSLHAFGKDDEDVDNNNDNDGIGSNVMKSEGFENDGDDWIAMSMDHGGVDPDAGGSVRKTAPTMTPSASPPLPSELR